MILQAHDHEDGGFTALAIPMTGGETDADCKAIAWEMFCHAHPVEAHQHDPDGFWKYFHQRAPHVSREAMERTLRDCEE